MFYCKAVTRNGPICPLPDKDATNKSVRRPPTITINGQVPNSQSILPTSPLNVFNLVNDFPQEKMQSVQINSPNMPAMTGLRFRLPPISPPRVNGSITLSPRSPPKISERRSTPALVTDNDSNMSLTTNGTDVSEVDIQMLASTPRSPPKITRSISPPSSTPAVNQLGTRRPQSPPRIVINDRSTRTTEYVAPRPQSPPRVTRNTPQTPILLNVSDSAGITQPPPKIVVNRKKITDDVYLQEQLSNSIKDIINLLKSRGLSTVGTTTDLYNRSVESLKRGIRPYVNIAGEEMIDSRGTCRRNGVTYLQYGQQLGKHIVGEGICRLERQSYDPTIALGTRMMSPTSLIPVMPVDTDLNVVCKTAYLTDPITLGDLTEIADQEMIYVDQDKRCYYLPSILSLWEQGFNLYDSDSKRIVPSYPQDIHGKYLHPITILSVYRTAISRGIRVSDYPLLDLLNKNSDFLHDLARFIREYARITKEYDQLSLKYPDDLGLWNRRDLLAYSLLMDVYLRYHLTFNGARKYVDVPSGPGRNGTQIFYQPLLVAFFLSKRYWPNCSNYNGKDFIEVKWLPKIMMNPEVNTQSLVRPYASDSIYL
jgi:hypothetical protein